MTHLIPRPHASGVRTRFVLAALLLTLFRSTDANASVYRLDDSGTVVSHPSAEMRWRQLVPGRAADNTVETTLRVDVRLNVAPWLNRPCRIFMLLAPTLQAPVHARWTTQGRLLPGRLSSGERALVYEGLASPAVLSESILLSLETDGLRLARSENLQFSFEIEVSP